MYVGNEARQSRGIGSFFFAAIPAILGCAALTWLGFATGIVEFSHSEAAYQKKQTYEGRRDARVGVNGELLKPIDLVYSSRGCVRIDRAYLDTQTLTIYIHNTCPTERRYVKWRVAELSPDGTAVSSKSAYLEDDGTIEADEKQEITVTTSDDARVVKMVATIDGGQIPH